MIPMPTDAEIDRNRNIRYGIIESATRHTAVLFDGKLDGTAGMVCVNRGLLTHFTIEGRHRRIKNVRFTDFNNMTRINVYSTRVFENDPTSVVIPVAGVARTITGTIIKDLRGAMYMDVVNANAYLELTGKCAHLIVKQHYLTGIPGDSRGFPLLPVLDLSHQPTFIDVAKRT